MRIKNTYPAWPIAVIVITGLVWSVRAEFGRDLIRQPVAEVASSVTSTTRHLARALENAFSSAAGFKQEDAKETRPASRSPQNHARPAKRRDIAPAASSVASEAAPDPAIVSISDAAVPGAMPAATANVAVAHVTDDR